MSTAVIRAERLGKEYVIGARQAGRETFREMLTSSFAAPFHRFRRLSGAAAEEQRIWALKDVSFEVAEGEVVGIIGRNGAGKSTLLKILSRITEPTEGRAVIRGRVASLLEVGTGFHPELTGRENIHLNGAILGMSRAEIERKFDEIVAFAEVDKFLDTPVKRYSSGMAVRLAFAVAAHLEPEILLVDEVLAVGDAAFQKKCLGKMQEVSGQGRTVIFVSHNMAAISALCTWAFLLRGGRRGFAGNTDCVIEKYLSENLNHETSDLDKMHHFGSGEVRIRRVILRNDAGDTNSLCKSGQRCHVDVVLDSRVKLYGIKIHLGIYDGLEHLLAILDSHVVQQVFSLTVGIHTLSCEIPRLPLSPGVYTLNASVLEGNRVLDGVAKCASLGVIQGDYYSSGLLPRSGPLLLDFRWHANTIQKIDTE